MCCVLLWIVSQFELLNKSVRERFIEIMLMFRVHVSKILVESLFKGWPLLIGLLFYLLR